VPRGDLVRPTKDRVKAAVFSALESRGLIEDAVVLDLFAGSGALAIEALSRGAARAVAVERHPAALEAIATNRGVLADPSALVVRPGDAADVVRTTRDSFDLVFCDPPYEWTNEAVGALLAEIVRIAPGGVVVVERPARPQPGDQPEMPHPSDWRESWRRVFGDTLVVFSTTS
jgi:16S rRNA (guanine966-N2)-methyltransferase